MPEKFGITIPNNIPGRADDWVKSLDPIRAPVHPVFSDVVPPRIQDVEVPEKIKPFLDAYAKNSKNGDKTFLPDSFSIYMRYGRFPISPSEDVFGFLPIETEYKKWFPDAWNKWWDQDGETKSKFLYWEVDMLGKNEGEQRKNIHLHFSPKHELIRLFSFKSNSEQGGDHSSQAAVVSFRGRKLYRLWVEFPNGTLFPDPRGPVDSIWPSWVKGEYDRESPATQADWEKYIARVRKGERVLSGKTRKYVHQTEKQANDNLEASREFINNKSRQVFYFRRTLQDPGFVSMEGYKAHHSEYGFFLPKKSPSTRRLDFNETKSFLTAWSGEF